MVFTKCWPDRKPDQRKSIKYQLSFLNISQGPYLHINQPYMGSWPLWVRVNIGTKQCLLRNPFGFKMSSTLLYGWKQLGSAIHCWTAAHKFHCQTSREMEALQPPLNNTKTNCFIFFPTGAICMKLTDGGIKLLLSACSFHLTATIHYAQTTAKPHHNTPVLSDRGMWLHAESVFVCFLSNWGIIRGAGRLMQAQVTKSGYF